MKALKLKRGDMIIVQWKDIKTAAQWMDAVELDALLPPDAHTIGFFYHRDKKKLTLCHSRCEEVADGTVIPTSCIVDIHKLRFV